MTTSNKALIFWLVLGGIIFISLAINHILKINKYIAQKNYIKSEMSRSRSKKEYEHWKRKLKYSRLRLIPIIGHFIKK